VPCAGHLGAGGLDRVAVGGRHRGQQRQLLPFPGDQDGLAAVDLVEDGGHAHQAI
jgi:hypothetical protein